MNVVIGSWFRLPRLGKDTFSLLMRQRVKYDISMGFKMDSETDIESAVRTISKAIGQQLELHVLCSICGKVACPSCPYLDACDRRKVSPLCLCDEHSSRKDVYSLYQRVFSENLRA